MRKNLTHRRKLGYHALTMQKLVKDLVTLKVRQTVVIVVMLGLLAVVMSACDTTKPENFQLDSYEWRTPKNDIPNWNPPFTPEEIEITLHLVPKRVIEEQCSSWPNPRACARVPHKHNWDIYRKAGEKIPCRIYVNRNLDYLIHEYRHCVEGHWHDRKGNHF